MQKSTARLASVCAAAAALAAGSLPLQAQFQNPSFESPVTPFVSVNVDGWNKAPKPGYFDEGTFGFSWVQTAGIFANTPPSSTSDHIDNLDGTQSGYLLAFPSVSLSQESTTTAFAPGASYDLTVGLFGKNMAEGSILTLSLYYVDGGNKVTVASTPITYSSAEFPSTTHMTDFHVTVPTVQPTDQWAGKDIGVEIESVFGTGAGYWDIDNVRLTSVPEPASAGVAAVGAAAALFAFRRLRRQS